MEKKRANLEVKWLHHLKLLLGKNTLLQLIEELHQKDAIVCFGFNLYISREGAKEVDAGGNKLTDCIAAIIVCEALPLG